MYRIRYSARQPNHVKFVRYKLYKKQYRFQKKKIKEKAI